MNYKIIFLFIISIIASGCAHQINIYKDGIPLPKTTYQSNNIQTKMEVFCNVGKFYLKGEENDKYLYPEWLKVGNDYGKFEKEIKYIGGKIKITNPKEINYMVILNHEKFVKNKESLSLVQNKRPLYIGSKPRKIIEVKEDYNVNVINANITIKIYKIKDFASLQRILRKLNSDEPKENKLFQINYINYNIPSKD